MTDYKKYQGKTLNTHTHEHTLYLLSVLAIGKLRYMRRLTFADDRCTRSWLSVSGGHCTLFLASPAGLLLHLGLLFVVLIGSAFVDPGEDGEKPAPRGEPAGVVARLMGSDRRLEPRCVERVRDDAEGEAPHARRAVLLLVMLLRLFVGAGAARAGAVSVWRGRELHARKLEAYANFGGEVAHRGELERRKDVAHAGERDVDAAVRLGGGEHPERDPPRRRNL
mmetsp:Transcript_17075/g.55835  ORF Transcript_17075/g.55835 Transcript_17075/m.55835 type:complete len:223 (-) Transcript_17075:468-1136(-)